MDAAAHHASPRFSPMWTSNKTCTDIGLFVCGLGPLRVGDSCPAAGCVGTKIDRQAGRQAGG